MNGENCTARRRACGIAAGVLVNVTLLGPVTVARPGSLGGAKPTTLLALLATHAGTVVSNDQIVDALWLDRPPANVRATIHTYVSSLRRILGAEAVVRKANGYLLSTDHVSVDVDRARQLVTEGRALLERGDHEAAVSLLGEALALWRGDHVLGGAAGEWVETQRGRLAEYRLAVHEDLLDAALAVGVVGVPLDALAALVAQHPLRERLRAQLIRSLVLVGRRSDALSCYRAGCRVLADELAVQPGPELQAAWQQLQAEDVAPQPAAVPRQLPPDIADFAGRTETLGRLTASRAPIVALFGQAGAGKSTLAVHIGQLIGNQFEDGQLFADLGGTAAPRSPVDVLGEFLRALGVPADVVPASEEERIGLYRSLLAERSVLVLLDDAANEAQVRPLLPSGRNCRSVTTSRVRLSTLAGAEHIDVPSLSENDALGLLARIVGDRRLAGELDRAKDIVRLCGRLPLAVRLAGARLSARPGWPLARLADRLREQRHVLDELRAGDLEVRGSLNLSYQALTPPQRAALRRVAWLGTPDFSGWLLAALLDVSPADGEDIAEQLVDAQLAETTLSGTGVRYRMHDLTRAFGWERAEDEERPADLLVALGRVAERCAGLVGRPPAGRPVRLLRSVPPAGSPRAANEFSDLAG